MRHVVTYTIVAVLVVALALAFFPMDPVGVTAPGVGPVVTCSGPQPANGYSNCTFYAAQYSGYASFSYCFLGSGGLWLNGTYYAWTHPSDSRGITISSLCPKLG